MTKERRLAALTSSLSFKLFLVLFVSIVVLFAGHMAVSNSFQQSNLEGQVRADAARTGDLIRQSLFASMLRNERERTYAIINLMGTEPEVEAIRIYNKEGEIKFSSDEGEIGRAVDLQAEACYACHAYEQPLEAVSTEERTRIYRAEGDLHRILGLIVPIHNHRSCWAAACHAHSADQSVLGVLDVQMSLERLDKSLADARENTFLLAVGVILLAMLVVAAIVYRAVYVPTHQLREGTEALARGELDTKIELDRSDELGALAKSFNRMAENLEEADAELRAWSRTLEDRVRKKSEELEEIHRKMIQVEKAASLGTMAATVAHELNNPLSGILTYAKLVAKRLRRALPESDDRQRMLDDLDLIRSESARCGNIVRDLLTYAREHTAEFESAHLHELVERALKLVDHHTELGGVETVTEMEMDDDSLVCDKEQVVQALIALMINAVEAMPDGGILTVRTNRAPGDPQRHLTLTVSDTGVGIPHDVRDRIFDPFFSTKNEAKGVGLGLAVVYGIVQRHRGEISVKSKPGEGTTFTIELPRDPGAEADRTVSSGERAYRG